MTEQDAIDMMNNLSNDPEEAHCDADDILLEFLKTHRYKKIAKAYENARERVTFYYS